MYLYVSGQPIPWDRTALITAGSNRRLPVPNTRRALSLGTVHHELPPASRGRRLWPLIDEGVQPPHPSTSGFIDDITDDPGGISFFSSAIASSRYKISDSWRTSG